MIRNILADIRYGARGLFARPGFAAVVVLTLALGIGVNVALFSLFQQILLRPLPVAEPDRLVNLTDPGPDPAARAVRASLAGEGDTVFSYPMFRDLERDQEPFVGIAAHRSFEASLATGAQARLDTGLFVSGSYFPLLGLQPALGRLLGPEDDRVEGQAESVVLSHAYWQSAFGGDRQVLGRRLIVNGTPLTIVGVAPPGFHGTTLGVRASVFVPITFRSLLGAAGPGGSMPNHDDRGFQWVHLFARLGPGITREEAAAAINSLYRSILQNIEAPLLGDVDEQELASFRSKSLVLEPGARGQSLLLAPARARLEMLLAVSGVVLLLCCGNVAGLMLVRSSVRKGEIAVRASIGATRGRLASLLVAESLVLALPAALLSLPVALLTLRAIAGAVPRISTDGGWVEPSAAFDVSLSSGAAFVGIAMGVLSALAFGLIPLRHLMRTEPSTMLQAYGPRQTSVKGVARFRMALATVQVALSMALLAVAGVGAQSLANIARADLGLDVDEVATFSISPQASGYAREDSARLLDRLERELEAIPGVSSVTSATFPLLTGGSFRVRGLAVEGVAIEEDVPTNFVGPDFFRTLGIPLLAGRDFLDSDTADAMNVAIVNRRFAERFGFDGDVIGRSLTFGERAFRIVGLAADAKYANVTGEIGPQIFLARAQSFVASLVGASTFYVRGARPAEELTAAVRETAARVDPNVPIANLRTMRQQVRENLATERFVAAASGAFALLATVLAGLGLYGVLAYSVAQRAREIGLRFALGAPASRIRGMVLRQVSLIAAAGVVLGVAGAILLGRAARSVLYGVEAADPLALAGAAAVLAAVTLGAAFVPARRASRVDPMVVLRYE